MPKPNAKKGTKATIYKRPRRLTGTFAELAIGERAVLKWPAPGAVEAVRYFEGKRLTLRAMEKDHERIVKLGLPVVKIKGRLGPYVKGKKLRKQKMTRLILEPVRQASYDELVAKIGKIGEIIDKASMARIWVDPKARNLAVDKNGELKLSDFYPLYRHRTKADAYGDNISTFLCSVKDTFSVAKSKQIESLLRKELGKIEDGRKKRR